VRACVSKGVRPKMKRVRKTTKEDEKAPLIVFPIHQLPLEVIIKIVYEDKRSLVSLFSVNNALWKTQSERAFWPNLLRTAYPYSAFSLCIFLTEAPELLRLWDEALIDLSILTTGFTSATIARNYREHSRSQMHRTMFFMNSPRLFSIERKILQGYLSDIEKYYSLRLTLGGCEVPIGKGCHHLSNESNGFSLVVRRYLIKMYLLLDKSQAEKREVILDRTLDVVARDDLLTIEDHTQMHQVFDYWITYLEELKAARYIGHVKKLRKLKDAFQKELEIIATPDPHTGKEIPAIALLAPTMIDSFQQYFGLSDEETIVHLKKIFVQSRVRAVSPIIAASGSTDDGTHRVRMGDIFIGFLHQ
jgi:hypothetical protein